MLTQDGKRLALLDNLPIDYDLPKHRRESEDGEESMHLSKSRMSSEPRLADAEDPDARIWRSMGTLSINTASGSITSKEAPLPWYTRWRHALTTKKPAPPPTPERLLTTFEFFASMKNTTRELEVLASIVERYDTAIQEARKRGQTALMEQLAAQVAVRRVEAQLIAIGLAKYIEEADIVEFVKRSERGLRLDLLRNFMRPIPADLAERRTRCNELYTLDNYAVLHYDPESKSWAQTEADKEAERKAQEARRDPILFGLVSGSRRLYYIGDWVDETCDLTLEQMAEVMGTHVEKVLEPS